MTSFQGPAVYSDVPPGKRPPLPVQKSHTWSLCMRGTPCSRSGPITSWKHTYRLVYKLCLLRSTQTSFRGRPECLPRSVPLTRHSVGHQAGARLTLAERMDVYAPYAHSKALFTLSPYVINSENIVLMPPLPDPKETGEGLCLLYLPIVYSALPSAWHDSMT